jgi:hypothetical protein
LLGAAARASYVNSGRSNDHVHFILLLLPSSDVSDAIPAGTTHTLMHSFLAPQGLASVTRRTNTISPA